MKIVDKRARNWLTAVMKQQVTESEISQILQWNNLIPSKEPAGCCNVLDSTSSGYGPMVDCCFQTNMPSECIKRSQFLDQLGNYQVIKNEPAPRACYEGIVASSVIFTHIINYTWLLLIYHIPAGLNNSYPASLEHNNHLGNVKFWVRWNSI